MLRNLVAWLICAFVALGAAGCGSITPSSVLMKGGTWAAKKLITKEIKERRDRDRDREESRARDDDDRRERRRVSRDEHYQRERDRLSAQ